jgi:RNA polymerase sigma-70 factor (ECF subfamily)
MATATQSAVRQRVGKETQDGVSRDCADTQRQKIANHDEEVALVFAAKRGDGQAFGILVTRIREDAEDVVQQSFQKAFVHLQTFEGKSSFATWLTRIAINEALMSLRRGRGLHEVSIDDSSGHEETALRLDMPDSRIGPEKAFFQDEQSRILSTAMDRLSTKTRAAIELRELGELSTQEAARVMGISVAAVKARVFHGRKKLRQELKRESIWMSGTEILRASRNANGFSRLQLLGGFGD